MIAASFPDQVPGLTGQGVHTPRSPGQGVDTPRIPGWSGQFAPPMAFSGTFSSYDAWLRWRSVNDWILDPRAVQSIVQHAVVNGVQSRFFGPIPPEEVIVGDGNYRESFTARGFNPRTRAVLDLLLEIPAVSRRWDVTIYAPEALTPFALLLRGRYPRYLGSEYAETEEQRRQLFPIPFQDLLKIDLPAGAFDVVISNEVFEHVPDLPRALSEVARILKPSGVLLATMPFCHDDFLSTRRAWFVDGQLQYAGEPEYHGNPVDPDKGSLVFQIPGWDILDMCHNAGFREACFHFVSSHAAGITGAGIAGIHVLWASP
jgi:SAM-dependent methyltransferase